MRILASPARRNRRRNPYNFLLSEAVTAAGCTVVDDLGRRTSRFDVLQVGGHWDVFHLHWPQTTATGSLPLALRRSLILLARVAIQRIKGARIVWTVHNVHAHDQRNKRLERWLMAGFVRLVDGAIFMTETSRAAAGAEMPALADKPFALIPHGVYGQPSSLSREAARADFGILAEKPVIGFLGDIKHYKGLDHLLDALERTAPGSIALLIVGSFEDAVYGATMKARLVAMRRAGHDIAFREGRPGDAGLADAIRACDVIALPYRASWNSGLAMLALENRRRILTSNAPVFLELRDELGPEWVHASTGDLTAGDLAEALRDLPAEDSERMHAFEAARDWLAIGRQTVAFYERLIARRAPLATGAAPRSARPGAGKAS